MEPLKNSTKDPNRQMTGFVFANNQPCRISEKARKKFQEKANELFSFGNIDDPVSELISVKRKAYTDPKKSAKKKKKVDVEPPVMPELKIRVDALSDWEEGDSEIEWSDCDADLSRTISELNASMRESTGARESTSSVENSTRSN